MAEDLFTVTSHTGEELLRINDTGDFFVRGEEVAGTSVIRDAFLDYARLYIEQNASKTVISIKSTVTDVLRRFPTEESRVGTDFAMAITVAQTQPVLRFDYAEGDLHPHVLAGVLQEMIQEIFTRKREGELARQQAMQAAQ